MKRIRLELKFYVFGFACAVAAIGFRLLFDRLIGQPNLFFSPIYAAVAATVWFGGWRPAVVTALSLYAAALFVDLPAPLSGSAAWLFVAYSVSCGVIIFFGDTAREAIQKLRTEIAEHQRTREALLQANIEAAKFEMAAMLAHTINNPLESMTTATYLLRTSGELPTNLQNYVEILDDGLKRVTQATREALRIEDNILR